MCFLYLLYKLTPVVDELISMQWSKHRLGSNSPSHVTFDKFVKLQLEVQL